MSDEKCTSCSTDLKYKFVVVERREIIPTSEGGIITRNHLEFCSYKCMVDYYGEDEND